MGKPESNLFADLDALMHVNKRTRCLFMEGIDQFSDEDKQALALALANPRYTTKAITQVCQARGATFSKWAVAHHRKKECCCELG
jgi:hypothetical protein